MFGRFLEISVYAPEIRDSLAFYESLGFVQAPVGVAFDHPYAVVTDGRLFLGLHGRAVIPSPALTFVMARLMHRMGRLEELGFEFESIRAIGRIISEREQPSLMARRELDVSPFIQENKIRYGRRIGDIRS